MSSIFDVTHHSVALRMDVGFTVVLPSKPPKDERYPLLFLLHGLSDNHRSWLTKTNIARYAEDAGIAVVMPDGARSFYCDTAAGQPYYTYVSEELPAYVRSVFPVTRDPAETYIAGLSMGGYGALKIALRNPQHYGAVGSFSGCVDIRARMADHTCLSEAEQAAVFGRTIAGDEDVLLLTAKAGREKATLPAIYITCGLSDHNYEANRRLRAQLDFLRIPHAYDEWPGGHEWGFWDRSIRHFLQFLGK